MLRNLRRRVFEDINFNTAAATHNHLIAFCSQDCFSIFNACTLKRSIYRFETSSRCNSVDFAENEGQIFLSGDFDGTMRLWDVRNPRRPSYVSEAGRNFLPKGGSFNTSALSSDGRFICAGTCTIKGKRKIKFSKSGPESKRHRLEQSAQPENCEDCTDSDFSPSAYILCWDTRQMVKPLLVLDDIHSDDVNHIVFENGTSRFLSAADDCLVCLTDVNAPPDDRIIDTFNAESPVNFCDFLGSSDGVYAISNMHSRFCAWSLDSEADVSKWKTLNQPAAARFLLSAFRLPTPEVSACLLSTSAVKQDLRLSVVKPGDAQIVVKTRLFKKESKPNSDAFYARVVTPIQSIDDSFDILVVTKQSVQRLQARLT
nr:wd40 repeat [Hymenolepis microstoma]